jgi:hypothetical protein
MTTKARTGAIGGLAAAALLAGCGTTLLLNDANLESSIASWIEQQGAGTSTVTCPDDRPLQQGDVFECQAVLADGQTVTLQVTQTDNNGNVTWDIV